MKTIAISRDKSDLSLFLFFFTLLVIISSIAATISFSHPTTANTQGFKAGRIIDDVIFTNKSTMTVNDIQNFLNSKVSTCDTNGAQQSGMDNTGIPDYNGNGSIQRWEWGKYKYNQTTFPCLKDYTQDGISAAQLIYNASQTYTINPQVMIVLLQKEQGLVTDTWPLNVQYRSATGYGCPDTAACDSKYYGLKNQLNWAATMFRAIMNDSPTWYTPYELGDHYIQYNPNASCGGSTVNIENRSTQALYNYTPYQPSQAALDAGWGTVNCGAYGNRNFYLYFTGWFGVINSKPLIRTESSGALYFSDGINKFPVYSMDVARQYGLTSSDVSFVSQSSLDSIPQSTTTKFLTHYAKSTSDTDGDGATVYLISDGKKYAISSMAQMDRFNLNVDNITYLPYYTLNNLPLAGTLSDFVHGNDGFVYKIDQAKKSGIFQPSTYSRLNPSGSVSKLSQYILNSITTTTPTIDGYIGLKSADGKVWIATATNWSYVPSMSIVDCAGIQTKAITAFTPQQALIGPQSDTASCILSDSTDGKKYIVDNKVKYPVRDAWNLSAKSPVDALILSNKTTIQTQDLSVFSNASNGSLYVFENSTKRYVTSMNVLGELGQTEASVLKMSGGILSSIPNGHNRYQTNKILQDKSTGQLYVMQNDSKMYIPSMNTFNHYNYAATSITALDSTLLAKYSTVPTALVTTFKSGTTTYLIDRGVRITLPADLIEHYNAANAPMYNIALTHRATASATGTRYIKSASSAQLYYLENGSRRPVHSWTTFTQLGGTNDNITTLSESNVVSYPLGSNM